MVPASLGWDYNGGTDELKWGYRMDYEIKHVEMEEEFKICPVCGYKDGFHSMFKSEGSTIKWLFICPSCHEIFDIGFTV